MPLHPEEPPNDSKKQQVQIGELSVDRYTLVTHDDPSLPYVAQGWVEATVDGPRLVDLRMQARPGEAITARNLRALGLRAIVAEALRKAEPLRLLPGTSVWESSAADRTEY